MINHNDITLDVFFLSREDRMEIGHQIDDLLVGCSIDGYKCYAE